MNIEFSETANALYVQLVAGLDVADTHEVDRGTLVDVTADGRVIGIEIINPARPWPLEKITEDFDLELADVLALRSLWAENRRYPYAAPSRIASGSRVLVG